MNYLLLDEQEVYLLPVCVPILFPRALVRFRSIVAYMQNPAIPINNKDHITRRNMNNPMLSSVADVTYLVSVGDTAPIMLFIADVASETLYAPIRRLI